MFRAASVVGRFYTPLMLERSGRDLVKFDHMALPVSNVAKYRCKKPTAKNPKPPEQPSHGAGQNPKLNRLRGGRQGVTLHPVAERKARNALFAIY